MFSREGGGGRTLQLQPPHKSRRGAEQLRAAAVMPVPAQEAVKIKKSMEISVHRKGRKRRQKLRKTRVKGRTGHMLRMLKNEHDVSRSFCLLLWIW